MNAALEMTGVGVDLGGRPVLRDVALHIDRGELVGLLGPNGAGKTTLLRTALGLLKPATGTVRVGGRPARPGRTQVGYVPQRHEFAWDFPITVAGAVMTGLTGVLGIWRRPREQHWRAVARALERVGMSELRGRPVGELSGGQRQRVLVARALALRPALLLLDEPFTGLDVPTQELLTGLFAGLAREGHALLMATHDVPGALTSCDRLALLAGTIHAVGQPAVLAADPGVWQVTYGVGNDSALLRTVSAVGATLTQPCPPTTREESVA